MYIPYRIRQYIAAWKLRRKYSGRNVRIALTATVEGESFEECVVVYDSARVVDCQVGRFSYVAERTVIHRTTIGRFCSIGPDCRIGLGQHPSRNFVATHPAFFSSRCTAGMSFAVREHYQEYVPVKIGHDVWIGAGVLVADGVSIGNGAIIGAGAVVVNDIPPYAVVVGVPAQVTRYRFGSEDIDRIQSTKWWDWDLSQLRKHHEDFRSIESFMESLVRKTVGHAS